MKILPVVNFSVAVLNNNKQAQKEKEPKISLPNYQPLNYGMLGRDLISFGSRNFTDTLNENYFKLKEGFSPDKFQKQAGWHLNNDKSVLVSAPTGTGKTAIAHYAVSKNMHEGKKTFYTTPLKALSNQKYREFQEVWGKENVGILTGDRKENPDAPILIMTTEVYRNMAMARQFGQKADLMDNLGTVILDEFHYLADPSRGPVWEESVIFTPKDTQTLALSATIGNPEELTQWLNSLNGNNSELVYVPTENRHVPLKFETYRTSSLNSQQRTLEKRFKQAHTRGTVKSSALDNPEDYDFKNLTTLLKKKEQLPAIYFVFNRRASFSLVSYLGKKGEQLTTEDERNEIKRIMDKYKADNFSSLDKKALLNGYAVHNAGILPDQKAMIEELFQKKLIKVVVATETLGAGINMPAKTVVISQSTKPADREAAENKENKPFYNKFDRNSGNNRRTEEQGNERRVHKRPLTANEFHQMAGRAGRRGIDTIGYVYVMPASLNSQETFNTLISSPAEPISSKLKPDYAFLANIYGYNQRPEVLKDILAKSFYAHTYKGDTSEILDNSMKKTKLMVKRGFLKNYDNQYFELTDKGQLLSVIKGYSQIPLAEAVYNKYFDGLTPTALASVVGAMANPSDSKENAYDVKKGRIQSGIKIENGISSLYYRMQNTVRDKISYIGDKQFGDFKDMSEIVEYLNGFEMPDEDIEVLQEKARHYNAIWEKLDKLNEQYQSWTVQSVAKALQEGKTISLDAMNGCWKKLNEQMKKYQGGKGIDARIEATEKKLNALDMGSKKGNEKRKNRLEAQDLKYELELLKALKYIDEHLPAAMSEADKFVRANNYNATKSLAKKYTDLYNSAANLQELRVAANGCAQLEKYFDSHDVKAEDKENMSMVKGTMDKLVNMSAEVFNDSQAAGLKEKLDGYGKTSMELVYNFAQLNKINPDSMSNWQEIVGDLENINDHFDEGQFFRSVTQTIDLLSQISEMADAGKQFAVTDDDKKYYKKLQDNTREAIKLLNREPVVFN